MKSAPALAASWAYASCFWIIDSLSPVQVAWTSAPRTVRAIGCAPRSGGGVGAQRVHRRTAAGSVGDGLRPAPHVVLGELAAAPFVVEPTYEDVGELAIDAGVVVGQVAGPAVRDVDVAVDREDLVVGLPGARFVGVREPRSHDRGTPDDGFLERVEGVPDVSAEEVADGDRVEESPRIHVAVQPCPEGGVIHGRGSRACRPSR